MTVGSGDFGISTEELRVVAHDDHAATDVLDASRDRAEPTPVDVLRRSPPLPPGRNRVDQLMSALDASLRAPG